MWRSPPTLHVASGPERRLRGPRVARSRGLEAGKVEAVTPALQGQPACPVVTPASALQAVWGDVSPTGGRQETTLVISLKSTTPPGGPRRKTNALTFREFSCHPSQAARSRARWPWGPAATSWGPAACCRVGRARRPPAAGSPPCITGHPACAAGWAGCCRGDLRQAPGRSPDVTAGASPVFGPVRPQRSTGLPSHRVLGGLKPPHIGPRALRGGTAQGHLLRPDPCHL